MRFLLLPSGDRMPAVGLGTYKDKNAAEIEEAIDTALDAGYRHFDTAFMYNTEFILGKCITKWIAAGKGTRKDLFVTSKLPPNGMKPELVCHFLNLTLKDLCIDYVDLYLIHFPFGFKYRQDQNIVPLLPNGDLDIDIHTDLEAVWKALEVEVDSGKTKNIGISNFNISQIKRILKVGRVPVANHQVEMHAYFQQRELRAFCAKQGISVTAYLPLGGPYRKLLAGFGCGAERAASLMDDPVVNEIAQKYEKTGAQILLQFLLQLDVAVIPRSTNINRVRKNFEVQNFELDDEDLMKLQNLDEGAGGRSCHGFNLQRILEHHEYPFERDDAPTVNFTPSEASLFVSMAFAEDATE